MRKIAIVYWSGTGNTEAMAAAVARLRDSAGLRREMGANGRRLAAERFSEERFLAGFGRLCGGSA